MGRSDNACRISSGFEPAPFVARRRPGGAVALFGRSLRARTTLRAMASG
jgi:hypothetical protein